MVNAEEVAQWFIKKGYDDPRDKYDGNMKIQKLIYFSQLIHLAKHDQNLFSDQIYAFKNGCVVEDVRIKYRDFNDTIVSQSDENDFSMFTPQQLDTLKLTEVIFGSATAGELSEINHEQESWKIAYNRSKNGDYHFKGLSSLSLDDVYEFDLNGIKEVLSAFESTEQLDLKSEVINDTTFFYDPSEVDIADIIGDLENHVGDDSAYTVTVDESQGLVIY